MKIAMKLSKTDRMRSRICHNDDTGLNIEFPWSKYTKIWSNIKHDENQQTNSICFLYFSIFPYIFLYFFHDKRGIL